MNDMNTTHHLQHNIGDVERSIHSTNHTQRATTENANEKREERNRRGKKLLKRKRKEENEIHNTSQETKTKKQKTISSTCNSDVTLQDVGEFSPSPWDDVMNR